MTRSRSSIKISVFTTGTAATADTMSMVDLQRIMRSEFMTIMPHRTLKKSRSQTKLAMFKFTVVTEMTRLILTLRSRQTNSRCSTSTGGNGNDVINARLKTMTGPSVVISGDAGDD